MNYRILIRDLERSIKAKKAEIAKTKGLEKKTCKRWVRGNRRYNKAVKTLINLKTHGSKKEASLKKSIEAWWAKNIQLTQSRDAFRAQMAKAEEELTGLSTRLVLLSAEEISQKKATDEVVKQVFSLNDTVVEASTNREKYLTSHIFPHLFDGKGRMMRQVTFTNSASTRKVVALVNSITMVQGDMANAAKELIEQFFERFKEATKMEASVKPLYELTRQILFEKTQFKVGPDLYRFLSMDLNEKDFPELSRAQRLLRASIRSEKTNSYIRIYERESVLQRWRPVRQS